MIKKQVVINEQIYKAGFPECGGCPELTLGENGWFCFYSKDTKKCKYPNKRAAYKEPENE